MTEVRKSRSYKDLEVWQLSLKFVKDIYQVTSDFPSSEKFGLAQQIRRAAVSIPSNIAEGQFRNSSKE
jgi:four helix bundle protein